VNRRVWKCDELAVRVSTFADGRPPGDNIMNSSLTYAVLLSFAVLFSCTADNRYGPMHGPGSGWPMMHYGYGGWFMWLILVIVVAIAIYFIVQTQRRGSVSETPLEILKKRYAKGEITKEEYNRLKQDLSE
jgi:putative membrane protein